MRYQFLSLILIVFNAAATLADTANVTMTNSQLDREITNVTASIEANSESARLYLKRCTLHRDVNDISRARRDCMSALEFSQSIGSAYYLLAMIELDDNNLEVSAYYISRYLKIIAESDGQARARGEVLLMAINRQWRGL